MRRHLVLFVFGLGVLGCGAPFELSLPDRFAVLDEEEQERAGYDFRATTPDGVVVGAQAVETEVEASLEFWTEAITLRLRDSQGYELLEEAAEIRASSGQTGRLLHFGRDEGNHTYRYSIAIFVRGETLYLVEAGGKKARYEALEAEIESALSSLHIR